MTERSFDFKTDIKVELLIPTPGVFILGQSLLDGPDLLGADTDTAEWVDTLADVAEIYINEGMDIRGGILTTANPTIAEIVMQTETYDPNANRAVHVGTGIRVSVRQFPTTVPDYWTIIFVGKITNYETTYNFTGVNTIAFQAADALQSVINTGIPSFTTPSSPSPITEAIAALEPYMPNGVINTVGLGTWSYTPQYAATNTTVGEILNQILDTEIAAAYIDMATQELYLVDNAMLRYIANDLNNPSFYTDAIFSTTHPTTYDPTHYCIADIAFTSTTDDAANEIIASRLDNGYTLYERNTDSIDLYGKVALRATPNVWSNNQLQLWLNRVNARLDIRKVKNISFRMLDENNNIRPDRDVNTWFFNACKVIFNKGGLDIQENYLISRVEHRILPTTWETNLELWKGL